MTEHRAVCFRHPRGSVLYDPFPPKTRRIPFPATAPQPTTPAILPSSMNPADDAWRNTDSFRLLSRVQNSFSLDDLLARVVQLQNQKLNLMKRDSETDDHDAQLLQEIRAKETEIDEAERRYSHAKRFQEEILATARIEMSRLAMLMAQKEQRIQRERHERALQNMQRGRDALLSDGLTLIAFGQALNEIPDCKRERDDDFAGYVTEEDRDEARHSIFPLDAEQNKLILIIVREHEDPYDDEGEALVAQQIGATHLQYRSTMPASYAKVNICNLNEEAMQIEPVHFCKFNDRALDEEAREDTLTLRPGETVATPYPVQLDTDSGEVERGWRLQSPAGHVIMTLSFLPVRAPGQPAMSAAAVHPRSNYARALAVLDRKFVSSAMTRMIFSHKLNLRQLRAPRRVRLQMGLGPRKMRGKGRYARDEDMDDTSKRDAFLQSFERNFWCLIPSFQADGSPCPGEVPAIPLELVASDVDIPYDAAVPEYYERTVSRAVVLRGNVVDGIQYQLAINVSDDNPLNGTQIESFILTTTEMAMALLHSMPEFIKSMPGPLDFNKGRGATTFGGQEYQVLGFYAPPSRSLRYTSFAQNRTITFHGRGGGGENEMVLDPAGSAGDAQDDREAASYERGHNEVQAIRRGEIVVVHIKTPAMTPIAAYDPNESLSGPDEEPGAGASVMTPCNRGTVTAPAPAAVCLYQPFAPRVDALLHD